MEQIIANLLVADNDVIQKATADLQEAYKHPETIPALCQLVVSSKEPQIRQYSAVLLKKRLGKLRNWQLIAPEQQVIIKQGMLNALMQEQEKSVRSSIAQFIGVLIRHEADKKGSWIQEVLQFVYSHCSSSDPKQSELGSSIFATLTDVAPEQFVAHMESICEMFTAALVATEASGNMATPVIYNILMGMTYLVPFILGHNTAELTYQKSIPLVIKSLQAFAVQDSDKFVQAFDILESMADYTPKLLTTNIRALLDFCLEASNNTQLDSSVRVKTVAYIGWLVRLKKKVIVKQKLVEPIIQVVFNLMATEPESADDDEEYFLGEDNSNPMTTATQTMDLLALHVPPEKLIPPLLQLLEPALQGSDPLPRKAAFLSMAVIAEGCSEAICNKYLETMLNIVKVGITDLNPIVRNAAFFALGQFSEHLQPDITKFAPEILPILFEFLQQLCNELRSGGTEPKHIDRMFYALETFCENLEDALVPHLPLLMDRLFQALDPNNSVRLRELALSAVSAAANAAKENMLPFFNQLIQTLQMYLVKTDNEDIISLRPQAIDTLAAIARTIGRENFMPLATDTMNFALNLLAEADDPDVRRALYNLIASLAEVVHEEMGAVYPKIMERIYESILSTEEVIPNFKDDDLPVPTVENDENEEIDIELSEGEDDDLDNIAGYSVENSYLDEKEEAILALKEFALHSGAAFIPYLEQSYQNVYKMIDHPQEDIRKVSIDALVTFILALYKQKDVQGVSNAVVILIPKLGQIIRDDEEVSVVMAAVEGYGDLLKDLKQLAIPNDDLRDTIFDCINDVLLGKVACQFDDPTGGAGGDDENEESEYDEAIVESAGNIIPLFGKAMRPEQFAMFFGRVCPIILHKLEKAKKNEDLESQRCFAYGCIAECFAPLQTCSATYFDTLLPILLDGLSDEFDQARQNAVFGIGELVLYSEAKSYESFPQILTALSKSVSTETKPGALDNICGAIARLIMTNCSLIPLQQVLPVFLQHLPLKEDFDENAAIFKCFKLLYIQSREAIVSFLEQIIAIAIHVLYKKEFVDDETCENALGMIKEVRENYPDKFAAVANTNPDIAAFLQTI
ncbi:importin-4-like [Eupeodes corollae]|uniref:importin-4-like n=1 Tax=Eupeodes corollae TaxID=290404 RepID=UPI002492552A|nr:importin-4-like [Eupeodes corollae]